MRLVLDEKKTVFSLMRYTVYFCILMECVFLMWHFAETFKEITFEEYAIVENLQLILLFLTSVLFLIQSVFKTHYRALSLFLGSLCLMAGCRELDSWFDELWIFGWKFALIFPAFSLIYIYYHLNDFRKSLIEFCSSSAFFMMYSVAIVILPVAQCTGHKTFFVNVLGSGVEPRLVRRLFEESLEFIGYTLLLLSCIEYYIVLVRDKVKSTQKKIK